MKISPAICTLLALQLVAADVSHLNMKYLQSMMPNNEFKQKIDQSTPLQSMTTTSIEKQILHELPEQIEYGQSAQYGSNMIPMTMMMMPMPSEDMQPPPFEQPIVPAAYMYNRPSSMQYLIPNMHQAVHHQQHEMHQHQHKHKHSMSASMPRTQYLPPLNLYQQMQQVPQIHTSMPISMVAPFALDMPEIEQQQMIEYTQVEPQPAHMLTAKGYQYKTGTTFPIPSNLRR